MRKIENIEDLVIELTNAPLKIRRSAILAARRAIENKPTALLCSQAEAGRLLGVSRFTIWRMTREGEIKSVKVRGCSRYRVSELESIAEN